MKKVIKTAFIALITAMVFIPGAEAGGRGDYERGYGYGHQQDWHSHRGYHREEYRHHRAHRHHRHYHRRLHAHNSHNHEYYYRAQRQTVVLPLPPIPFVTVKW